MNLMLFDATPHWSGGANRILLFSRELQMRGHKVAVCCLPGSGLALRLPGENIPVFTIDPTSDINLFVIPELIRMIKENHIDLIEICSPKFYWVASLAAKIANRKVILTRNVPYRKKGLKKQINKLLYSRLIDRIIAVSDKIKRELVSDFSIPANKITVIYDGIELSRFDSNATASQKERVSQYVVAIISRLDENKGVECFMAAIPEIVKKIGSISFLIVGTGCIEKKLQAFTTQRDLEEKVLFTGFRTDIPEILAGVDMTVMPSPEEGMSMSALESMAAGRPVVATSGSGLVDVIVNNQSGIIVKPGSSQALAEGVTRVLQSDYRKMGKAARMIVEEKFDLQKVVDQYELLAAGLIESI
ncbi:glycosyltransferase family 4 protein [Chlorobium sp. KB01]|uniref:glycosyltransferase family 4 protein n=1 Tax=Chlorobium sp. KB01 TaxID=1917528 RepID=UPI000975455C|nr:glycosyltransferase family 4 protein [Chlorobium sp. KB01]